MPYRDNHAVKGDKSDQMPDLYMFELDTEGDQHSTTFTTTGDSLLLLPASDTSWQLER